MSKRRMDTLKLRAKRIAEYQLVMKELFIPMTAEELQELQDCNIDKMDIVYCRIRNRRLGV